jgi:hypothetical protein
LAAEGGDGLGGGLAERAGATGQSRATGRLTESTPLSELQIVIEKKRMETMTYKQHLFFNIIPTQI